MTGEIPLICPDTLLSLSSQCCNEDDFNYLLKESIVDNETFGTINNSQEKQTEKLLSQEGSVIINKILEKQNTYWGE